MKNENSKNENNDSDIIHEFNDSELSEELAKQKREKGKEIDNSTECVDEEFIEEINVDMESSESEEITFEELVKQKYAEEKEEARKLKEEKEKQENKTQVSFFGSFLKIFNVKNQGKKILPSLKDKTNEGIKKDYKK